MHSYTTKRILPGDKSKWVPPDPISNSEVKPFSAYDSVGLSMPKSVIARRKYQNPAVRIRSGVFFIPIALRRPAATLPLKIYRHPFALRRRALCAVSKGCRESHTNPVDWTKERSDGSGLLHRTTHHLSAALAKIPIIIAIVITM